MKKKQIRGKKQSHLNAHYGVRLGVPMVFTLETKVLVNLHHAHEHANRRWFLWASYLAESEHCQEEEKKNNRKFRMYMIASLPN